MATGNPFDLLGDDDTDDMTKLISAQQKKIAATKSTPAATAPVPAAGKLPTKPLPPAQAVREARSNGGAPRGRGAGRDGPGRGRGGRGGSSFPGRDSVNGFVKDSGFQSTYGSDGVGVVVEREKENGLRQPYRGGTRRGGFGNGDVGEENERPKRAYERRSGSGRGYEVKRDGAGRGNWGTATDDVIAQGTEEIVNTEEKLEQETPMTETENENKDGQEKVVEEKEEDKEMTLEEYEKIREEKRKALIALKSEERKVELDKELKSMQKLSLKKENNEFFAKLGSDKEKKKEVEREERVKKSLSINEFLKPAEGEKYYTPGGRGRGRGRSDRGSFRGGYGAGSAPVAVAPPIADPGHFPILGAN